MVVFIEPHTLLEENYVPEELNQGKPDTPMQQFYRGTHIFITGGSGFMGKVLTEQLLRKFPEVDTIYLLMREKRGKTVEERMDAIFDDPLFYKLSRILPSYRCKVRAVTGDCSLPGLGLSDEDKHLLLQNVDIVFHGAATVRFDEKLKVAVAINVNGTTSVVALAKLMDKLKAIVHVSTAYCNCQRPDIDEKFYDPPMPFQKMVDMVEACPDSVIEAATSVILGKWPNTYTLTKAVAEDVIRQDGPGLPIALFRPAVVVSTSQEPLPGWIDNIYGPQGVVYGAARGVLRTMHTDPQVRADIVPVDMATSAVLAAAWDVGTTKRAATADEIPVYNYVSSCDKPLLWEDYQLLMEKHGLIVPSVRAIWYYSLTVNKSATMHWLYSILFHYLPALFVDALLFMSGKQPMLWNVYKKIDKFSNVISHFSTRNWTFTNRNVHALWNKLGEQDQQDFMFDMRRLNWDDFFYTYARGCRVYLGKDPMSTLPQALVKYRRLYWLHQATKALLLVTFLAIVWFLVGFLVNAYSYLTTTHPSTIQDDIQLKQFAI